MIPEFLGNVKEGKASLDSREALDRWLLSLGDTRIVLTVKKYRKKRSNPQNKYWWGVVCKVYGDYLGYTPQEMHDALKWQFLQVPGELPTVRSTKKLTTTEFNELIEEVARFAAMEHGVYIPPPDDGYTQWLAERFGKEAA